MAKESEVFPIGTNVYAEDYEVGTYVHGIVIKIHNSKNREYPYVVKWCDGELSPYSFDQVQQMNNDYKTIMGLW